MRQENAVKRVKRKPEETRWHSQTLHTLLGYNWPRKPEQEFAGFGMFRKPGTGWTSQCDVQPRSDARAFQHSHKAGKKSYNLLFGEKILVVKGSSAT